MGNRSTLIVTITMYGFEPAYIQDSLAKWFELITNVHLLRLHESWHDNCPSIAAHTIDQLIHIRTYMFPWTWHLTRTNTQDINLHQIEMQWRCGFCVVALFLRHCCRQSSIDTRGQLTVLSTTCMTPKSLGKDCTMWGWWGSGISALTTSTKLMKACSVSTLSQLRAPCLISMYIHLYKALQACSNLFHFVNCHYSMGCHSIRGWKKCEN